ncbi:DUF349 domain-containing protein [Thalassotalea sp. LPB0316]|uniref:DUF349 domain-containing protein n=1 Tax=Thalassotalea sp. LPB0316 TaxID=2769490 RepID=UPI001868F80B|nr:DUF349 domain-containing protein [Thalassotalea sp. LPB0316]QOL25016.1 DUF349 domain-containing protein [Thalassotalea sp. LPB0316]
MIFSTFFRAKWQHKDETIRLEAVKKELDQTDEQDREVLVSIAQTDPSDTVRIAAFKKLKSMPLYWQNLDDSASAIRQLALNEIEKSLLSHLNETSAEQKLRILSLTKKSSLIESWYALEHDENVQTALFERLNKPSFLYTAFTNAHSSKLQLRIIEEIDELNQLEKCLKKANDQTVCKAIEAKLSNIRVAKEKPEQVRKEAQLTLSMLLALKEQNDYQQMLEKRQQLDAKWQQISAELTYLPEAEQALNKEKYHNIIVQLDKVFAIQAEAYQQQQIAEQLKAQKQQQKREIEQQLSAIDQSIANAIFETNDLDETQINQACDTLQQLIDQALIDDQAKQGYSQQLDRERKKLGKIPVIAQSVSEATHLIARIAQLAVPTTMEQYVDKQQTFASWLKDWKAAEKRSAGVLPQSLKSAYQEINGQWQNALAPFEQEQKKLFGQCAKKYADVKRLIRLGKYNASFGVYKHAKSLFDQLSPANQVKLNRDHEQVSEKIAELADWEHYVATPKKQELLAQITEIATTPKDDLTQQANLVKQYRKMWNSLGHAEEEQEKLLNDAFNEACEQAFSPCREFFAQQEKQRDEHVKQREDIIAELNALAEQSVQLPLKDLEQRFNLLKKQWQSAGEVARKRYNELIERYRKACSPITAAINQQHSEHKQQKLTLIETANRLLALDDVFAASNQIKQLQAEWKTIGFAGKHQENKLWQAFRQVNDQLFAKRDAVKSAQNQENNQALETVKASLLALEEQAQLANDVKSLKAINQQLLTLKSDLPATTKGLAKQIDQCIASVSGKISQLAEAKQLRQWQAIFDVIAQAIDKDGAIDQHGSFAQLPLKWQRKLLDNQNSSEITDRSDATLAIEILAGVESPNEYLDQRLAVQVKLMQSQMTSGGKVDMTEQFLMWLGEGPVTKQDLPFVERIKPVYCR